ncbi:MAG TPA: molybdopterin-dependent oxidoreductase, partial [Aquabacterium sp.]|nr:molybdopterin-dependent oxidoreductase [Aquabacterium sp.]
TPYLRTNRADSRQVTDWDTAMSFAANKLSDIVSRHGPDSVGFYGSGQLLTEDYYVLNKLVKGLIGTNNVDTNSRLCMSSAVTGYKLTLGSDAPPACYDDIAHAQTLLIAGSNTAYAHPILFRRIEDARRANPALKLIVVDPRRTETAEMADLFLPIQPGTDVALFHGMLHVMHKESLVDREYIQAHTQGFDDLLSVAEQFPPEVSARICGIPTQDLIQAARWFGRQTPTLSLYCQGLNQSSRGSDKNAALINLHLATGQIGRPGAGPFSLTGQPNAMGGREVGGMANLLSAHRDLSNPAHRAEVAALWGVESVPDKPGKTAVEMFEAAARGEIKALWIACTNPAQSLPDQVTVRRALETVELVVVQEAFATTATCEFADVLLPATTWGEKNGTVTNSERRISRVRPAIPPAGQARHDWEIFADLGRRLESLSPAWLVRPCSSVETLFPYTNSESVWNEHRESTRGRDLDITGLSYTKLESLGPQQWPMPEGESAGRSRLYEDGHFPTADGRARFHPAQYRPLAEPTSDAFPFSFNTGRLRDQWHGMSRTGVLGRLFGHVSEPCVELNPKDMAELGVSTGSLVRITSRRGEIIAPAQANDGMQQGHAYMGMHWGGECLGGRLESGAPAAGVNALTNPAFCPGSKQPELKHAAVRIQSIDLRWRIAAAAWIDQDRALAAREAIKPLMSRFQFASCVPFGREPADTGKIGILFSAGDTGPCDEIILRQLEDILGLSGPDVLLYQDRSHGQRRVMKRIREGTHLYLEAFLLAGDSSARSWLQPLIQDRLPVDTYGPALVAPGAQPPLPLVDRGKQVCACFNVNESAIHECLRRCGGQPPDESLAMLQRELKCGTNCGSCVPELRKIIKLHAIEEPAH